MTSSYLKIRRRIRDYVAIFFALIIIGLGFNVYWDYQNKSIELFRESRNQVRIIAEHASRAFGEVDSVLDVVINKVLMPEKLTRIEEKELYTVFSTAIRGIPQIASMFFVDAGGVLSASTLECPIKKINLSDREYFLHLRDTPGDAPFISRPYKNRITNKWNFVFSQRISNPDGSFAGLIGATIEMAYFETLYAELFHDTYRNFSLVRDDGFAIVMFPPEDKTLSRSIKESSMFSTHLPLAPIGVYREKNDDNGTDRVIAYSRPPANYPLIARITYDWSSVTASWRREALVKAVLVVLFGGLSVVLARLLMRRLYELGQSENERALLNLIVKQSPVSVAVTDPEGTISYVNPRFCTLTGYSAEEVIGQNPRILKTEFTPSEAFSDMWANLSAGREWSGELCNKKKDGSLYWEMAHLFPVIDNDGKIIHFAAIKEDTTERKQFVEELQRAKKVAEAANSAKSEFLANMSHEIRTPMNAISGMAYLTLQTDLDARQRDYVGKVLSASESLLGIINDILDFSKIEAGKLDLEAVTFDLSEMLGNVGNIMSVRAEEKGLEIIFSLSPDVPGLLVGDPLRLGQILNNLVGNSVKFTEQGQVVVSVVPARRETVPGRVVLIFSVTDSGIGMDDEQIGRIFAPFSQVDSSIARRYGGSGLGLSIVKRLVDLMGGALEVVSHANQGSRFSFTIEFGLPSEGAETGTAPFSSSPDRLRADLKRIKGSCILLVEDNLTNQQVAREILHQAGMLVEVAGSGREALDFIENGRQFDLVFMDIQMPDMDGFEIAALIRAQRCFDKVPIVAMTAHAIVDVWENCLAAGMNGHVAKPISPFELYAALVRWIRPKDATDTKAPDEATGEDFTFPASLTGVNVPVALERIGGNGSLLLGLLVCFREQHLNSAAEIRMAIETHNLDQARRLVHSLKGESGNLGVDSVFASTRAIEDALRDNRTDEAPLLLDQLQIGMEEVFVAVRLLEVNRAFRKTSAQSDAVMLLGTDELAQLLNELAGLLLRNKAAATKLFKELKPHLPDSPELIALEERIDRLDFKKGLVSLKHLAEELHVSLEEQP